MVSWYLKKPIGVQAVEFTKHNIDEVLEFIYPKSSADERAEMKNKIIRDGKIYILTLEGTMGANYGDYIAKGVLGEYYPINGEVFRKSYDKIK